MFVCYPNKLVNFRILWSSCECPAHKYQWWGNQFSSHAAWRGLIWCRTFVGSYTIGIATKTILSISGNSTRPVSVYSEVITNNYLDSVAGLKFNIRNFTLGFKACLLVQNRTRSFHVFRAKKPVAVWRFWMKPPPSGGTRIAVNTSHNWISHKLKPESKENFSTPASSCSAKNIFSNLEWNLTKQVLLFLFQPKGEKIYPPCSPPNPSTNSLSSLWNTDLTLNMTPPKATTS